FNRFFYKDGVMEGSSKIFYIPANTTYICNPAILKDPEGNLKQCFIFVGQFQHNSGIGGEDFFKGQVPISPRSLTSSVLQTSSNITQKDMLNKNFVIMTSAYTSRTATLPEIVKLDHKEPLTDVQVREGHQFTFFNLNTRDSNLAAHAGQGWLLNLTNTTSNQILRPGFSETYKAILVDGTFRWVLIGNHKIDQSFESSRVSRVVKGVVEGPTIVDSNTDVLICTPKAAPHEVTLPTITTSWDFKQSKTEVQPGKKISVVNYGPNSVIIKGKFLSQIAGTPTVEFTLPPKSSVDFVASNQISYVGWSVVSLGYTDFSILKTLNPLIGIINSQTLYTRFNVFFYNSCYVSNFIMNGTSNQTLQFPGITSVYGENPDEVLARVGRLMTVSNVDTGTVLITGVQNKFIVGGNFETTSIELSKGEIAQFRAVEVSGTYYWMCVSRSSSVNVLANQSSTSEETISKLVARIESLEAIIANKE
ncbi:MAG: hypothetical protein ACRC6B_05895, partial [Fusobacteriaceae bacterium]